MQTIVQNTQGIPIAGVHAVALHDSDEIRRRLGTLPIYVLRQTYGAGFAPGTPGDVTLGDAMAWIDSSSIALLARQLHNEEIRAQ
jgi:hypothetical protein